MEIKPKRTNKIKLEAELAYDPSKKRKKVIKDKNGNPQYYRHDATGLMMLLDRLKTPLHSYEDLKFWTKIKDKLRKTHFEKKEEIELTSDEMNFLTKYLKEFREKDGKGEQLREFEVRTLLAVLEQIG